MSRETREAEGFVQIRLDGVGHVDVVQGDSEGVIVEAPEKLLPHVTTSVEGSALVLGLRGARPLFGVRSDEIRFTVSVRNLESLVIGGSGSIHAGPITSAGLVAEIDGSGRIKLESVEAQGIELGVGGSGRVHVGSLRTPRCVAEISGSGKIDVEKLSGDVIAVNLSGAGKITISGEATHAASRLEGSGRIYLDDLRTAKSAVSITGSGRTKIWATDELDATIEGSGRVGYRGKPTVRSEIRHSGKIVALDT